MVVIMLNFAETYRLENVAENVDLIGTYLNSPIGGLPINCYAVKGEEPMLIDTGPPAAAESTLRAIEQSLELASLKWIYITHVDSDHVGGLKRILEEAPKARILATQVCMLKLLLSFEIPEERFQLVKEGSTFQLNQTFEVLVPPCFDAPETTILWQQSTGVLFSSDYFVCIVPKAQNSANELSEDDLREGMVLGHLIDFPWIKYVDRAAFEKQVHGISALNPSVVLGAHLPPAKNLAHELARNVLEAQLRAARTQSSGQ